MGCRKFKSEWTPTPLLWPQEYVARPPATRPAPTTGIARFAAIFRFAAWLIGHETLRWLSSLLGRRKDCSVQAARTIGAFAQRMGGMWFILTRFASLRSDLLGPACCRELALTQNRAVSLPYPAIHELVSAELHKIGTSFDQTFSEFQQEPLATRSFGQFHRARLRKNGVAVLVRVRTSTAVPYMKSDWRYLRFFLAVVKKFNIAPHLRWEDLLFEVKKIAGEQLDFRVEMSERQRLRKILRRHQIYVPIVYSRLCSERLLVAEFISGVPISELQRVSKTDPLRCDAWFRENGSDRRRIWKRFFKAKQELLLEQNLFYTELVPASILLLRQGRIALVNYNAIGTLECALRHRYRQLYMALLSSNYTKVCDIYLAMGPALPTRDVTNMRLSVMQTLRAWESRTYIKMCPYQEKSLAAVLGHLARCATAQRLPTFWNLARLHLAEQTLDSTLGYLDPTQSCLKALQHYERWAQRRVISRLAQKGVTRRLASASDVAHLNMQLVENLEYDGDYLRRRLLGSQGQAGRVTEVIGDIFRLCVTSTLLALGIYLFLHLKRMH